MPSPVLHTLSGLSLPIIYGTAWKKEKTAELVVKAILAGFQGIDTACQPKHYDEELVGQALATLQKKYEVQRQDLFLQTKFTSLNGQDPHNIPYDKNAPLVEQVRQSLGTSLINLQTDYLDSLVMHSPMGTVSETLKVWRVFEEFHGQGKVKQLGISNIYDLHSLRQLYEQAIVKPSVVQNRFYASSAYDVDIRQFCLEHDIVYQSFWTLSANPHLLNSQPVQVYAAEHKVTPQQAFFRYVMDVGITPLTGTTDELHMKQDLEVANLPSMPPECVKAISKLLLKSH